MTMSRSPFLSVRSSIGSIAAVLALTAASVIVLLPAGSAPGVAADPSPSAPPPASAQASPAPASPSGQVSDACAPAPATPAGSPAPSASPSPLDSAVPELTPTPMDTSTPEPVGGQGNASGDVPDNAVFLTYRDPRLGYSIQYVEGWQVTPAPDGVAIHDKDSSETVRVVPLPADIAACVASVELPALQAMPRFSLMSQDRVRVNGRRVIHLRYHLPSPPDPVTGKRVPSTVDRYYVPGPGAMAVVSLSTPDGVDNVDAFRQMILSLAWS
jgi:hypothetical protein